MSSHQPPTDTSQYPGSTTQPTLSVNISMIGNISKIRRTPIIIPQARQPFTPPILRVIFGNTRILTPRQPQEQKEDSTKNKSVEFTKNKRVEFTLTASEWLSLVGIIIISLLLNFIICYLYSRSRRLRKHVANTFLVVKACADILSGMVYVPILVTSIYYPQIDYIRSVAFILSIFLSTFCLLLLALERYFSICRPLNNYIFQKRKFLITSLTLMSTTPVLISLVKLAWKPGREDAGYKVYLWFLWSLLLLNSICVIVIYSLVFAQISKFMKRRLTQLESNGQSRVHTGNSLKDSRKQCMRRESRVAKLGASFFVFHILGYYPAVILNLLLFLGKYDKATRSFFVFTTYSYAMNSLLDPLLCLTMKQDYKKALKEMIHSSPSKSNSRSRSDTRDSVL